jgi:glucokinase
MSEKLILGIDIGGTGIEYGLVDTDGKLHYENELTTTDFPSAESLCQSIYNDETIGSQLSQIKGIGIGAPNGNYYHGTIEFAPNLPWKGIIPLREIFEKLFCKATIVTNDANAAALGEKIFGVAKHLDDFVTITLGTGVGSGVISSGTLIYGHDGFAGEFGHIRVIPDGRLCGCGRKGCHETYASSTGVVRSISELPSKNKSASVLTKLSKPTAKDVFDLSYTGDLFAMEIVDFTARILGNALADFACFSSPKAFVLFGGIAQSKCNFTQQVERHMNNNLLVIYTNKIKVLRSSLHDDNAAVLGAASLLIREISK